MNTKTLSSIFILLIFFSGCALVTDEYQANQRKVIAYLLEDLPLPEDAQIVKAPTVLLGTGEAISIQRLAEAMGRPNLPVKENTPGEPDSLCADTRELRQLGWYPTINIMDHLKNNDPKLATSF